MEGLAKRFGPVCALDGVDLEVRRGEVHALVGENGAGKATLMKILSGIEQPTAGRLLLDGQPVTLRHPLDAQRLGIAMIHQELNLVDELTVAENIYLGRERRRGPLLAAGAMRRAAAEALAAIGAEVAPTRRVGSLSIAQQQMVEIAKAVSWDARLIIMDEPTAVLTLREVALLMKLIGRLRDEGRAVIYVSHMLGEVLEIGDRITVLRDGRVVTTLDQTGQGLSADAEPITETRLAHLMVGREVTQQFPQRGAVGDTVALRVDGLSVPGRVTDAGFAVRAGEVFGFAGLIGAGRTELAEAIAGLRRRTAGSVRTEGRIAYLSEDRRGRGLVMGMSITANTTLASLRKFGRVWTDRRAECNTTRRRASELGTKLGDIDDAIDTLSGGNQQKVALAKWLETDPSVLILDEPTRGIDVGAKAEIYRLIHDLAGRGLACVVISSELTELLGLCHRIAVMRAGSIVDVVDGPTATEASIMRSAAGVEQGVDAA